MSHTSGLGAEDGSRIVRCSCVGCKHSSRLGSTRLAGHPCGRQCLSLAITVIHVVTVSHIRHSRNRLFCREETGAGTMRISQRQEHQGAEVSGKTSLICAPLVLGSLPSSWARSLGSSNTTSTGGRAMIFPAARASSIPWRTSWQAAAST